MSPWRQGDRKSENIFRDVFLIAGDENVSKSVPTDPGFQAPAAETAPSRRQRRFNSRNHSQQRFTDSNKHNLS